MSYPFRRIMDELDISPSLRVSPFLASSFGSNHMGRWHCSFFRRELIRRVYFLGLSHWILWSFGMSFGSSGSWFLHFGVLNWGESSVQRRSSEWGSRREIRAWFRFEVGNLFSVSRSTILGRMRFVSSGMVFLLGCQPECYKISVWTLRVGKRVSPSGLGCVIRAARSLNFSTGSLLIHTLFFHLCFEFFENTAISTECSDSVGGFVDSAVSPSACWFSSWCR